MKSSLRAIIWYIYSGEITFSPEGSSEPLGASAKSVFRFAHEVRFPFQHGPHLHSKVAVAQDG
jgi:hypothetical protein